MESAIFGLVGVALGALLAVAREWWFQSRKNRKDAEYLSVLVSCELERYVARCAEVVGDNGLSEGQRDINGYCTIQVDEPKFEPLALGVDWKSLPAGLMYEILDFPYTAEVAKQKVSAAFEYAATPPDFDEGFEERQLQYATLGIAASQLVTKLRDYAGFPARSLGEWNSVQYMEEQKAAIELHRKERASAHRPLSKQ
jgi:hypothetical protein